MASDQVIFSPSIRHIAALVFLVVALDSAAASNNGFVLEDALVPLDEILSGGPGRDGIPSLDHPVFVAPNQANFLKPTDRVLGIEIDGVRRAYPIKILNYHEIVNDLVADEAVVITYCPLCGSGMAFRSKVNGKRLAFGVSGLLYNSDVLLYDRQTESLWSQLDSTAISGEMKGTRLELVPLSNTTWQDWAKRYPDSKVLSNDTGFRRNYSVDPYPNYSRSGRLYFPVANEDRRYHRKAIILGLEIDGHFKAYPFDELKKGPPQFIDEFQGNTIEIRYDDASQTAEIMATDGARHPSLLAYWFAWIAFHPGTEVYAAN